MNNHIVGLVSASSFSATPPATCLGGKSSRDCSCNLFLHFCGAHTASAVAHTTSPFSTASHAAVAALLTASPSASIRALHWPGREL